MSLDGSRISSSDISEILSRIIRLVQFALRHDDLDITIQGLVDGDQMLRYLVYYMTGTTPSDVTVREFAGKIGDVADLPVEDLESELFLDAYKWLMKWDKAKFSGSLKAYLERTLPYSVAGILSRHTRHTGLTVEHTNHIDLPMSIFKPTDDPRASILGTGVHISGRTITDIAKQMGITYRMARYIITKEADNGKDEDQSTK